MWLYSIFAFFDNAIYSMVKFGVRLIMLIANYDFFAEDKIGEIADKIYVILGVLMLFKLVISAVQYMVNPDTFDDKDKGMGGILKKLVICMALLVLIKPIFNFAMYMQKSIVSTIPGLILKSGEDYKLESSGTYDPDNNNDPLNEIGNKVAGTTIKAFISLKKQAKEKGIKDEITDDLTSFNDHIRDGCNGSLTKGLDLDICYYDYKFGISTAAGIFLLYVILSMTLDVGIRAIKLGILQILAPIPISSYIVSKDKLSKFFKLAINVYVDLFIRLAVIYFIIYFVDIIIGSIGDSVTVGNGYTAGAFETAFVKIAIIIALFMFAKNAPKFISEVLGISGDGFGDMQDMFKPAWQRAGGAAGALVNPARGAVTNYRKAMENNTDMGSKLRRAMNASRHAAGGFGKGALDSVQGIMAGDDWAKMSQRHDAAKKRSEMRSAAGYMKRTDKQSADERNEAVNRRREQLENFYKSQGINVRDMKRSERATAEADYNSRMSTLNNNINTLGRELSTGMDSSGRTLTADQLAQKRAEFGKLMAEHNVLSTRDGREQFITNRTNELVADALYNNELSAKTARKTTIVSDINNARMRYASATTDAERASIQREIVGLMDEQTELDKILSNPSKLKESISEYVSTGTLKTEKPDISTKTIMRGKVDSFFGGEGFTGKGYIDTADLLKNNRSSLYTGEAMTKMRQNADILVDASGNEATFEVKFTNGKLGPDGKPIKYSYSYVADLKRRVDAGDPTVDLASEGFANSAMLQSAFEDMEKQAAEAYVTANMAAADPTVHSNFKLKGNAAANTTIVEGIKRLKAQIAASNIPKEEKDALLKDLSENPGKFFKGASDRQEKMRTKGSRISAYNSGKKDS